mmetsp:Transcript_304/g.375  ORF Transcript_304/g.375 Transcript_304/m.375 type:complete len:342 (-) Transcript_304:259-1284(-)|eukprot:CAMPEP_0117768786 /NCGR_PEP_ID=MMETSP0947-20121206/22599_1 /TAXON_ID=44440 /ORGANISM="Chattonella subsalsa, Strain CCMP2191" /LENGTH=341 /DNA_ID=CAMNT_0005593067 /DNA_START=81 /DNA_END=1106 /DNA_ORIENTATION=-
MRLLLLIFSAIYLSFTSGFGVSSQLPSRHTFSPLKSTTELSTESEPVPIEISAKEQLLGYFSQKGGAEINVDPILACPVSLSPVTKVERYFGPAVKLDFYEGVENSLKYPRNPIFADFVAKEKPIYEVTFNELVQTGTFRSPLTAFLYERGWRQNFDNYGFKGIDNEFVEVQEFFSDLEEKSPTILDLSCGSGLMTRRLVGSGKYSRVLGADFSEAMLLETHRRFLVEGVAPPELVRLDVAQMPFQTESLDGIHAGAALHCYPRLKDSLAEIYRVLKKGGKFYASTFLNNSVPGRGKLARGFKLFELDELRELMKEAGFTPKEVSVTQEGMACAIVKCNKV